MSTITTPSQNLTANVPATFPAAGQVAVGDQLANRHIDTLVNLSVSQQNDATLTLDIAIEASFDPASPPAANSWVPFVSSTWQGGQADRNGNRLLPRLNIDTSNTLPQWARQRVTANKNTNGVTVTVTVN